MFDELKCITIEKPYAGWPNVTKTLITLDVLYDNGWWITETFGSYAVIIKKTDMLDGQIPKFRMLYKRINLANASLNALNTIEHVKEKKWDAYKKYMLVGVSY